MISRMLPVAPGVSIKEFSLHDLPRMDLEGKEALSFV